MWKDFDLENLFGEAKAKWAIDDEGVLIAQDQPGHYKDLSFPETSYDFTPLLDSWWVSSRAELILKYLKEMGVESLVEIGAGNGYVAVPLSKAGLHVIGVEPLRTGSLSLCKNGVLAIQSSFESLNLIGNSIDTVGAFDVIEHIQNDSAFIAKVYAAIKTGGYFFVTVPAHRWLYSDFDHSIGHYRRYSGAELGLLMKEVGFTKVKRRHFFVSLVVPALILRKIPYILGRRRAFEGEGGVNEECQGQMQLPGWQNRVMKLLMKMDFYLRLPLGLSLLGVYQKKRT